MDDNPVWQAINKELNATLKITYTPGASWKAKLQVLLASGDVPDICPLDATVARLPEVTRRMFADLTDYVAGDKIAQYENLARLPAHSWKQTVFNGGIYGVPQPRPRLGGAPARVRADIVAALDANPEPKSGQELIGFMRAVTDPRANRWSSSSPVAIVKMFAEMLEAPNVWAEHDGKFTHEFESDELAEAISQVAALWKEGVFHPDSFAKGAFPRLFDAGQSVMEYGNFDPGVRYTLNSAGNPHYRIGFLISPKFSGGGPAKMRLSGGFFGFTAIKPGSAAHIEEILRILDWCAAPVGSAESLLARFGLEGRDYTLTDGMVKATPQAASDVVVLGYLATPNIVYIPSDPPSIPVYQAMHTALVAQYQSTVDNPALGLYSASAFEKGAAWETKLSDLQAEIIQGRKSIQDWKTAVQTWRQEIGDAIRSEYQAAFSDAND